MRLGILDQVPRHEGDTIEQTMEATKRLVVEAERLGYDRYWFAEHHNTNGLLSAAPELFIARMGDVTSRRLNSVPAGSYCRSTIRLKIAETFSTLAAFYPNRIELGIGNSPGGSERTRRALTDGAENAAAEFPRILDEVEGFLTDSLSSRHPYRIVKTTPRDQGTDPVIRARTVAAQCDTRCRAGTRTRVWSFHQSRQVARNAADVPRRIRSGRRTNTERHRLYFRHLCRNDGRSRSLGTDARRLDSRDPAWPFDRAVVCDHRK